MGSLHAGSKAVLVALLFASLFMCSAGNANTLTVRDGKYGSAERESLGNSIDCRSYSTRDSRGTRVDVSPTGITARRYSIDDRDSLKNFLSLNQNETGRN